MGHLSVISELEMFYKDPNIEELTKHTADLILQLKSYEEFYELLSVEDINNIPSEAETEKGTEEDEQRQDSNP